MVEGKLVTGDSSPTAKVDRWRAILDAATALFAQPGFARVSVQEIADQAQAPNTTVLYHFDTKETLYGAVLDEAMGRMGTAMRDYLAAGFESDGLRERVAYLLDQNIYQVNLSCDNQVRSMNLITASL